MKSLLVLTVGQTDVQVVSNGKRHKLDGNTCGELLDIICQGKSGWELADTPSERSREIITQATLPSGKVQLCTPKLDAILRHLDNQRVKLTSALILETTRTGPRDPRQAGNIVKQRLCDKGSQMLHRLLS